MRLATTALCPSTVPLVRASATAPRPQPSPGPQDKVDLGQVAGGLAGGVALGATLGYVGLQAGARLGAHYAMHAFPGSGAAELLTIFAAGVPYMTIGACLGGAVGLTGGGAVGAYLGSSLAGRH